MGGIFQPDAVDWCDGSAEEYDALCAAARRRRARSSASTRPSGPTATSRCPTPATSPASRTARSSAPSTRSTPAPPTTGGAPAEMKDELLGFFTGAMRGRTMYVVPFSHGPARLAHRPHRRAAHRLGLRRRHHADHDPHGPGRPRRARATATSCRACTRSATRSDADGTPGRRAVAVRRREQVHRPLPRDPRDLDATARATAATPCSARSASPCASPRPWPATTAGWPSTCSSSASRRPTARRTTSPRRSRRPAARPTWPC